MPAIPRSLGSNDEIPTLLVGIKFHLGYFTNLATFIGSTPSKYMQSALITAPDFANDHR